MRAGGLFVKLDIEVIEMQREVFEVMPSFCYCAEVTFIYAGPAPHCPFRFNAENGGNEDTNENAEVELWASLPGMPSWPEIDPYNLFWTLIDQHALHLN
jgi:hypothetical protein